MECPVSGRCRSSAALPSAERLQRLEQFRTVVGHPVNSPFVGAALCGETDSSLLRETFSGVEPAPLRWLSKTASHGCVRRCHTDAILIALASYVDRLASRFAHTTFRRVGAFHRSRTPSPPCAPLVQPQLQGALSPTADDLLRVTSSCARGVALSAAGRRCADHDNTDGLWAYVVGRRDGAAWVASGSAGVCA